MLLRTNCFYLLLYEKSCGLWSGLLTYSEIKGVRKNSVYVGRTRSFFLCFGVELTHIFGGQAEHRTSTGCRYAAHAAAASASKCNQVKSPDSGSPAYTSLDQQSHDRLLPRRRRAWYPKRDLLNAGLPAGRGNREDFPFQHGHVALNHRTTRLVQLAKKTTTISTVLPHRDRTS